MKKKTNIIYIVNSLIVGGTQKVLIDNANNLNFEKYNVHIISLSLFDKNNTISNIIDINPEIKVHYVRYGFFDTYSILGYISLLFKSKKSFNGLDNIISLIHSIKPDIIHFHTSPRELIIRKFLKVNAQFIFTDHTLRINRNEYGIVKSKVLAFVFSKFYSGYKIITVSEEIKNSLIRNHIVAAGNVVVAILNGVNVSEYSAKNRPNKQDKFVAIYVSRIDNNKGHLDLINAWSLLKDLNNKCLYIVGPDSLNGEIQRVAAELGCMDSVIFTGSVSNPKEYMDKADIAVFPSYKEGLPLALLEKMAMNLPVIVSNINELTSIISDKEDGLVFQLGNSNDLSEKIRFLYLNPAMATQIGANARKTVTENYNSTTSTIMLENFYNAILN